MAIGARRCAGSTPEHRTESTNAVVAQIERHLRHWGAISQASHRFEHARLLAPGAKRQAGFALEMPRERAGAGVERRRPFIQRALIAWRVEQRLAKGAQPGIARHRQLQGQGLQAAQFGDDQGHDVPGRPMTGSTPEAYLEKLKFETARWTKVVKDNDIKVEG